MLKAGHNLMNGMAPEQAMMEAFDKHDVALILSLFGQSNGLSLQKTEGRKGFERESDDRRESVTPVTLQQNRERLQQDLSSNNIAENTGSKNSRLGDYDVDAKNVTTTRKYREIKPLLDETDDDLLDVDPNIMDTHQELLPVREERQEEKQTMQVVDPLKKLFG
ncbi:hypothetical protein ACI2KR_07590 [Pseudomonas luteola]